MILSFTIAATAADTLPPPGVGLRLATDVINSLNGSDVRDASLGIMYLQKTATKGSIVRGVKLTYYHKRLIGYNVTAWGIK